MIIIIFLPGDSLTKVIFREVMKTEDIKKIASMSAGEANKNKDKTIKSHKKFLALKT